jgi:cytochrome c oxidase cbb3-type subunit III
MKFGVRVKTVKPHLLAVLLRAVFTLTPNLLVLAACYAPEQDSTVAQPAERTAPPSVSYEDIPSAGTLPPPAGTLANPFSADPGAIEQGQMLFAAMNCDGCHGGGAVGFVGPSLIDGRWRYGGEDGALFHSIFYGRPHGMPAYGGLLNEATVWQLITYLRSQPVPGVVPTMAWQ